MAGVATLDTSAVADAVERWRARYEASDAEALKALWDREHVPVTYLPTETKKILVGWDAISAYYDGVCSLVTVQEWRVWDVVIDAISETSAFAVAYTDCTYRLRMDLQAPEQYWAGRVSFNFHRCDDAWKLIHYEDSTPWQWMIPLLFAWQAPRIADAEAAIRAADSSRALNLLFALRTPPGPSDLTTIARRKA